METRSWISVVVVATGITLTLTNWGQAQDVVLNPGYISGTIDLSGLGNPSSIQVVASASEGYTSATFTMANMYEMPVEGGYSYSVEAHASYGIGSLSISKPGTLISVDVDELVEVPEASIAADVAAINGWISVTGATVTSYWLEASADNGAGEEYSAYRWSQVNGSEEVAVALPMVVDDEVEIRGSVYLDINGMQVYRSLSVKNIASDETPEWSFDFTGTDTGAVAGNVSMTGDGIDGDIASRNIHISGGGSSANHAVGDNGEYQFDGLSGGNYFLRTVTTMANPGRQLNLSGAWAWVTPPSTTFVDLTHANIRRVPGTLSIDGFYEISDLVHRRVWTEPTDNQNGSVWASSTVGADGSFEVSLPPGSFRPYYWSFSSYDWSPEGYTNVRYREYDDGQDVLVVEANGAPPETKIPRTLVEALVVLDVAEPGWWGIDDPEIGIRSGTIVAQRDTENGHVYLTAYGPTTTYAHPVVRVMGSPGTYMMDVQAKVDNSTVTFAKDIVLELSEPTKVPQNPCCGPLPVTMEDVRLTFTEVTNPVLAAVTRLSVGPQAPFGFQIYTGLGQEPIYFDINVTGEPGIDYAAGVDVCISYIGENFPNQNDLKLYHWNVQIDDWEQLPTAVDTIAKEVCGVTDSFSPFVIGIPIDSDGDGVYDADDNCPLDMNPAQFDLDNDGYGDVCDDDDDGDGWDDDEDNCPVDHNPDQADYDGDTLGDACDDDDDDDGVLDEDDVCQETELDAQVDPEGCSSPQLLELACPQDGDYKNHGQYVSCVSQEAQSQVQEGLISPQEKAAIVAEAAQSGIGK